MKKNRLVLISLCGIGCLHTSSQIVQAQVTIDGTTNTVVNADGNGNFSIEQGDRAGNNLFHSFDNFSVPTNGSASFGNAADISNIFNRVTGGNISNIDGLIEAQGGANLFLVNPAGIIFGSGARLEIGGSFFGTTADSILFTDGEFSATDLDNPPLLTVNAPIGLNFRDNPGDIVNGSFVQDEAGEFVGLEVEPGNNLSLIGGDINFEAGEVTARGGRVELGGLESAGTVTIEPDGSLTFPEGLARANVTFANAADADVRAAGGGSISVNANNIDILGGEFGGSSLAAGILSESTSADAQAGDVILNATGTISLAQSSNIFNQVGSGATGNAGNIIVNTANLSLLDGSQITAGVFGTGNAGRVEIVASEDITFQGIDNSGLPSGVINSVAFGGVGSAGNVTIEASNINLIDGSSISSDAFGTGNAGNVEIDVANSLTIAGLTEFTGNEEFSPTTRFSQVSSQTGTNVIGNAGNIQISGDSLTNSVGTDAVGSGGNISITADSLTINDGAFLSSSTLGQGDGGDINIQTQDSVLIDGSGIFSQIFPEGAGDAGDIRLDTSSLSITNGGQISSSTLGQGNAGNIEINVAENISLDGQDINGFSTGVNSFVAPDALGNAGNINISSGSLSLTSGASVNAGISGQGDGGDINIRTQDSVLIDGINSQGFGSGIFSQIFPEGAGDAGDIRLDTSSLSIINGGQINSGTFGIGDGGNIFIKAVDSIVLDGTVDSEFFAGGISSLVGVSAEGDAGNIEIAARSLFISNQASISGNIFGRGDGGNINIQTDEQITISGEDSAIFSSVGEDGFGSSGDINLVTRSLFLTNEGEINNSIQGEGNAGVIDISADEVSLINGEISTEVDEGASGNAGSIILNAAQLSITDEAELNSSTSGEGNAGSISINANQISLIGGEISTGAESEAVGDGGNISIVAVDSLEISGTDTENFSSGLFANTEASVTGDAGNISINTLDLQIINSGTISVDSLGMGDGGLIAIESQSLELDNNASISTRAISGLGGNANIQIEESLILKNNSQIVAGAFENAIGGNVSIDAGFIIAFPSEAPFDGNDIIANAELGSGGNISRVY